MSYEILIKKQKDEKKDWRDDQVVTTSIIEKFYAATNSFIQGEKDRERKFYQEMVDKEMIENERERVFYVKVVELTSNNCNKNNYNLKLIFIIVLLNIIVLF